MKNLVYLLVLVLAPMAPTNGKEIVAIDPKKNEVKVDDQTLRIATISEGFVTWVQESDLAFQFFVWNDFNKEMHSWFTRPWDDYMTERWKRRGTHVLWSCRPVNS